MKIVLDLKHSFNNFNWESKEELKEYIDKHIIPVLWGLYKNLDENEKQTFLTGGNLNRLYDILDMFTNYTIE